jgi:acetoin utilization deacetylase AcuC-like enzyme
MAVVVETHQAYFAHDTGHGHPERPARLRAVLTGIEAAGVADAVTTVAPRAATREELERIHPALYLDALQRLCESGGGNIDADTTVSSGSWDAAVRAAGAGLDAIERLDRGEADSAFCAVRPPGHHATPRRSMGFCLINNVGVAAAALAARGERVMVVDYDAHHGNGTQDAFYADGRVLYVSMHEFPLYPGTGRLEETGVGDGAGTTVNLPFPAGPTGDTYRAAIDELVVPVAERFGPTWMIVSAGFDAHRDDPLTDLGLTSGDYADLTERLVGMVPPGRRLVFLEGGYDLDALSRSAGACVGALAGVSYRPEAPSSGGPGRRVVEAAVALHLP